MKIIIQHFKCFRETHEFVFAQNQLNLFHGKSGIGKSTVCNAVYWCLYGTLNRIKPHKKSKDNKTTYVSLEFPNIYIKRSNILEVTTSQNQILTGETAQGYINNIFGNKNLWLSSSYITQKKMNYLLDMSNTDKFLLLHELTFGCNSEMEVNTSEYYLNICESSIDLNKNNINIQNEKYQDLYKIFMDKYNNNKNILILWPEDININELENYKKEYNLITDKKNDLYKILSKITSIEFGRNTVLNLIHKTNEEIDDLKISEIDENLIENLKLKYESVKKREEQFHIFNKLNNRKKEIGIIPDNYKEIIPILQEKINQYDIFIQKCNKENIKPDNIIEECENLEKSLILYKQLCQQNDTWKIEKGNYDLICKQIDSEIELDWNTECNKIKEIYNSELQNIKQLEYENNNIKMKYDNIQRENKLKKNYYDEKLKEYQNNKKNNDIIESNINDLKNKIEILNFESIKKWWNESYPDESFDLSTIDSKKNNLYMLLQELICPHCGAGVRYENNTLYKGNSTQKNKEYYNELLVFLDSVYDIYQKYFQYQNDIDKQKNKLINNISLPEMFIEQDYPLNLIDIPNYPKLILPSKKIAIYPNKPIQPKMIEDPTNRLNRLKSLLPPLDGSEIQNFKEQISKLQLGYELDHINNQLLDFGNIEIDQIIESSKDIITQIENLTHRYQMFEIKSKILKNLQQQLIPEPEKPSDNVRDEINVIENRIITLTNYIQAGDIIINLNSDKLKLEQIEQEISTLSKERNLLENIRNIIAELATSSLDDVVNMINSTANLIARDLFEESINIVLCTRKELKTKDKIKLIVNLQIHYQDAIYEDISYISGGEGDRVSMALTLAIAKVSDSPILILDECMTTLDATTREKCLKAIKNFIPNKTIIHILPLGNKGRHDNVVNLNSDEENNTYEI